jgi:hypothetical protein
MPLPVENSKKIVSYTKKIKIVIHFEMAQNMHMNSHFNIGITTLMNHIKIVITILK